MWVFVTQIHIIPCDWRIRRPTSCVFVALSDRIADCFGASNSIQIILDFVFSFITGEVNRSASIHSFMLSKAIQWNHQQILNIVNICFITTSTKYGNNTSIFGQSNFVAFERCFVQNKTHDRRSFTTRSTRARFSQMLRIFRISHQNIHQYQTH